MKSVKFYFACLLTLAGVCSPVLAQNPPPDKPVRVWAASCAACHGTHGVSNSEIPSIAGLPREVLLQKLLAYKRDELSATVMHQHAKGYTDEELGALADHFAKQRR